MIQFDPKLNFPTSNELPDSDGLPVDNELHILVPNFLGLILGFIWGQRFDLDMILLVGASIVLRNFGFRRNSTQLTKAAIALVTFQLML
ncbi:MAG: hypothetical protein F6K58_23190 [Symploca sp. SIO2E9]|nr:hypothetical protein [Symploca sp. SIO2E9]